MKLARWYVVVMLVGLLALAWVWYEFGWRLACALFAALWANNAAIEIANRARQAQRVEMFRTMGDARRRIREMVNESNARSAAPSGVARVSAQNGERTNTEAEVPRTERP